MASITTSSPRSRSARQVQVDDVEPVVEVLAEPAGLRSPPRGPCWSRRRPGCRPSRPCVSPTRVTTRSCRARSSFTCRLGGMLADLVEEERAAVARLELARARGTAPVKAPLTCPNSSLSSRFSGMAPQLMATNGPSCAELRRWSSRAISSLPVPVSPVTSTEMSVRRHLLDACGRPPSSGTAPMMSP